MEVLAIRQPITMSSWFSYGTSTPETPLLDEPGESGTVYEYREPSVPLPPGRVSVPRQLVCTTDHVRIGQKYYQVMARQDDKQYVSFNTDYPKATCVVVPAPKVQVAARVLLYSDSIILEDDQDLHQALDGHAIGNTITVSMKRLSDPVTFQVVLYESHDSKVLVIGPTTKIVAPVYHVNASLGFCFNRKADVKNLFTAERVAAIKQFAKSTSTQSVAAPWMLRLVHDFFDEPKKWIALKDYLGLSEGEIAAKLTAEFKDPAIKELYISDADFIIQYINTKNFNIFLFNHLRSLIALSSKKVALAVRCTLFEQLW